MVTITASTLTTLLNDKDIKAETAEEIIDLAVDLLNLFGKNVDLPNMTGTSPGSKTLSVDSREKGAIMIAARAIYYGFYKGVASATTGPATISVNDVMGNATVINTIRLAAEELREGDITIG